MSETPRTDEHLSHLNLPDGNKVGIPIETIALLRRLERELNCAQENFHVTNRAYVKADAALTQAQARCAEARHSSLEEAARACESLAIPDGITDCVPYWECAKTIRSLKSQR